MIACLSEATSWRSRRQVSGRVRRPEPTRAGTGRRALEMPPAGSRRRGSVERHERRDAGLATLEDEAAVQGMDWEELLD